MMERFERGLIYSNTHMVTSADGDESVEYVLIDEDMETLGIARGA